MNEEILEKISQIAEKTIGYDIKGLKAMTEQESYEWHKKHSKIDPKTGDLIISANEIGDGSYEKYINDAKEYQMNKDNESFDKYIDCKWHYFEGYENGSCSVRFRNIYKNQKGIYVFDGDIINWATIDSHFDGDGIIIQSDCEEVSFSELPYCREHITNKHELIDFIEYFYGEERNVETDKEVKNSAHEILENLLNNELDI